MIFIDNAISGSEGINGSVFITNVQPQSNGNVGEKVYSSDGVVLDSCKTDTNLIRISILAITGHTNYKPLITVNGIQVNLIAQPDKPLFNGTIDIDLGSNNQITALHEDGASHVCFVEKEVPPIIQTAYFVGDYPGIQTELKAGDSYQLYFEADKNVIKIELDNYGVHTPNIINFTERAFHTININIANRGNIAQLFGAKIKVQTSSGSWSDWYFTENDGDEDKVNVLNLNNQHPELSITSIIYPTNQQAIKNDEEAVINNTALHFDTITYSSPNSQLSIQNVNSYQFEKIVQRISGNYNINTNNITISANRQANNSTSIISGCVRIAHTPCTLTVSESSSRLRSGGNDGTSIQTHTITITANQQLIQPPSLVAPIGNWQGSGFVGGPTTWTRQIQIHDSMIKGTYTWGNILGKNLAGIETEIITGNNSYVLGGFVSRQIPLEAFSNEALMNVESTNYANVSMSWEVKSLPNKRSVGTISTPDPNSWCLHSLNTNPTIIRILDTQATNSSSQQSLITIQETV